MPHFPWARPLRSDPIVRPGPRVVPLPKGLRRVLSLAEAVEKTLPRPGIRNRDAGPGFRAGKPVYEVQVHFEVASANGPSACGTRSAR